MLFSDSCRPCPIAGQTQHALFTCVCHTSKRNTMFYLIMWSPTFGHCDINSHQATCSTNQKLGYFFVIVKFMRVFNILLCLVIFQIHTGPSWLMPVFSMVFSRKNIHLVARKVIVYQPIELSVRKHQNLHLVCLAFFVLILFPQHL